MSDKKQGVKKQEFNWAVVLWYIHLHVLGLCAIWLILTSAKWMTTFFTLFITAVSCLGLTTGAHRLWAHKSFTATGPLRLFLMLAHTVAGVGPIYDWVLYHRLHHKYYGTDKDPYNHNRGFFYSHYVSNCASPTVDYEQMKREVDMRDMEQDGYVLVQKKFYWPLWIIFAVILPLNAPLEYWDESMMETIIIAGFLRFAITTNVSWLINSALLVWNAKGNQIVPNDFSMFLVKRSFWPSYHYTIPWDWKTGEFGTYGSGCSSFFIKMWQELGLIDAMQTADTEDVREMLHRVAKKKITLEEGLRQLDEISKYNMKKQKLLVRH